MVFATCRISGFCHEVDEICSLLAYCTVYSGNSLKNYHQDLLNEWAGMYRISLLLQVEDEKSQASFCLVVLTLLQVAGYLGDFSFVQ
jgi:hypothetical protein